MTQLSQVESVLNERTLSPFTKFSAMLRMTSKKLGALFVNLADGLVEFANMNNILELLWIEIMSFGF